MYYFLLGLALLLVRILLSVVFFNSVRNKLGDMKKFAKDNNLPLPAAWLQVAIEGFAVISLLPGLFPSFGALAAMLAMCGSMYFHVFKWRSPYWAAKGGWEYDLMIFSMAFVVAIAGGGIFSLFPVAPGWMFL